VQALRPRDAEATSSAARMRGVNTGESPKSLNAEGLAVVLQR
jgi:hypothetical protein